MDEPLRLVPEVVAGATATRNLEFDDLVQAEHAGLYGALCLIEETVFCLFEGTEGDVRAVAGEVGVPVERVVESRWVEGSAEETKQGGGSASAQQEGGER